MTAIGTVISRSFLVVMAFVALAVPGFSQSQKGTTIALLGAPKSLIASDVGNVSTKAAPASPVLQSDSLDAATRFALLPAIKGLDQWTADERETFRRQINASVVRWNVPESRNSISESEVARTRRVVFVNSAPQPGKH